MDKPVTSQGRQGSMSPDSDEHQAVSETQGISPNLPTDHALPITRNQGQSNEGFDSDEPRTPTGSSLCDEEPREHSPVTQGRRRKLEIRDSDGYDKGSCFYRRLAVKAERVCKQPRRYKWYHGLLHRWVLVPWRRLWSPRV